MNQIQVTMTELRQRLGTLVNQAAYGSERVVLVSHGQPKAAIIGVVDLQRLEQLESGAMSPTVEALQVLAATDELRERIRQWQEERGIKPESSIDTLNRLRQERDRELSTLP
jgi:prevent-host-death family protein